ncbi:hypothetical protein [Mesorhizobium sp.]|uniref:hypothetical protein n=1 Tax=Mesorhizobium sp. TaxID=1871066 RepID=UPI000FE4C2AB|nr:hypothetical protein [Mesorhizobium sp.]RWC47530.1 MAG: hypothetical protein EOS55_16610 [Mesorhizobium sp.]RWC60509.1 MAG: hypothetical protein EOS56_14600 [Mesorhizobium sp.]RWC64079.1 MAG: hypothetical protein EOS29_12875 [Mesorhizobium sp.]
MINWRQGGLRVWLVASVAWVIAIAWQHRLEIGIFLNQRDHGGYLLWDAQETSGRRLNDPAEVRRYSTDIKYVANPLPRHPMIMLLLPRAGLSEDETQHRIAKSDDTMTSVDRLVNGVLWEGLGQEFLPWAFGPPIAALGAIWILGWIVAGFKKR